jgi:hypothetical protein
MSQVLLPPAARPAKALHEKSFQQTANEHSTTQYNWDEQRLNHERLEELQNHGETRWSQDGHIVIDDSVNQRTGEELLGVGRFYDHAEGETVWGQNLVYAFYTDDKSAYPLTFRQYGNRDDENEDETKDKLAREIITELEEEVSFPLTPTSSTRGSLMIPASSNMLSPMARAGLATSENRQVTYSGEKIRVDALEDRIDKTDRVIDDEMYQIWTQKRHISKLGEVKLLIAEKVTDDESEANPVKYLATNKIDAPSEHVIQTYSYR